MAGKFILCCTKQRRVALALSSVLFSCGVDKFAHFSVFRCFGFRRARHAVPQTEDGLSWFIPDEMLVRATRAEQPSLKGSPSLSLGLRIALPLFPLNPLPPSSSAAYEGDFVWLLAYCSRASLHRPQLSWFIVAAARSLCWHWKPLFFVRCTCRAITHPDTVLFPFFICVQDEADSPSAAGDTLATIAEAKGRGGAFSFVSAQAARLLKGAMDALEKAFRESVFFASCDVCPASLSSG